MNAILESIGLIVCAALLMCASVAALTSTSVLRRLVGLCVALMAAALAGGVLGVPVAMPVGAVALMTAYCVVGAGILVRLQETYGGSDAVDIDSADDQAEPRRDG